MSAAKEERVPGTHPAAASLVLCPSHTHTPFWLRADSTRAAPPCQVRHCARSVFPDLQGRGVPQYDHYANYTQYGPLPDWGVPPSWCTTRGTHIVRGQGRQLAGDLKAQMGARKVKVVPDPKAQRDLDTAAALLEGAGIDASVTDMQPDAAVFDPQAAGICHYPTGQQVRARAA